MGSSEWPCSITSKQLRKFKVITTNCPNIPSLNTTQNILNWEKSVLKISWLWMCALLWSQCINQPSESGGLMSLGLTNCGPKIISDRNSVLPAHLGSPCPSTKARKWKQPRCRYPKSTSWKYSLYTKSEVLPSYKENELMKFAGKWMDEIILDEVTQVTKDKHMVLSYLWVLALILCFVCFTWKEGD